MFGLRRIEAKIDALAHSVNVIASHLDHQEHTIMADLTALTAAVEANSSVVDSAVLLIEDIAAQLRDVDTTDPAAIAALADELTAKSGELAAAVAANTPAA